MPNLLPEHVAEVSRWVAAYITEQRASYLGRAIRLSEAQCLEMRPFFTPELLDQTRILVLTGEQVPNPSFYPQLRQMGFENLPDQSTMAAITFVECIVSHVPFTNDLLFHELVHVEQYRQLGVDRFADLYLRGFLKYEGYFEIPLERNAYALGTRYEKDCGTAFSVQDDVSAWIAARRF